MTGWIIRSGDSLGMGNQLKYIAEHRDEAARLGRKAREIAVNEYSQEREVADYKALYREVLRQVANR